MIMRAYKTLFIYAVVGGALALGVAYWRDHQREPMGIAVLIMVALVLICSVVTFIGMRRPLGARFSLSFGLFQRAGHPFQQLAMPDAVERWRALGQPAVALLGGWACKGHCDVKLFVGEANGQRYYLFTDAPTEPWFQWAFGNLLIFCRDAPLLGVPTTKPASHRSI